MNTENPGLYILKSSLRMVPRLVRNNLLLLFLVFLFLELTQGHFLNVTAQSESLQSNSLKLLGLSGQLLTSILEFLFFTMFVPLRQMEHDCNKPIQESFFSFARRHLGQLTVEGLRATAYVVLWMLAFIIPGLLKYLRYSFVPYVVVADPEYLAGKRDALEYSNHLVKGFTLQLLVILMVFAGIEIVRTQFRENFTLLASPIPSLLGGIIFFGISLFTNIILFKIYQHRVKTVGAAPTT